VTLKPLLPSESVCIIELSYLIPLDAKFPEHPYLKASIKYIDADNNPVSNVIEGEF